MPSLARSVPKPLKVPSLARSVPKPLKVPSLARSVRKPLKVGQEGGRGRVPRDSLTRVPRDSLTRVPQPLFLVPRGRLPTSWSVRAQRA